MGAILSRYLSLGSTFTHIFHCTRSMYKLRTTLKGHKLDVRGVAKISESQLVSASRDGSGRLWDLKYDLDVNSGGVFCYMSPTGQFINSVAYIPEASDHPLIAFGGKEQIISLCPAAESFAKPGDDNGTLKLVGHTGNVCSLDAQVTQLISGSWDYTAKVWDLHSFSVKYDLVGHSAAVWDAKIVSADQEVYLTCSADKTIRKWQKGRQVACFTGHNDVVRKLLVLPGGNQFVSASNDGTLKIWELTTGKVLQSLEGHTSFVYDVGVTSTGDIVSTAEDRSVRIWRNGKTAQVITLPCLSAWCVSVLSNDDIAVGGSGKDIYVFTTEKDRFATEQGLANFGELVQLSRISEQSLDNLKRTDLPSYDRLSTPGNEEGAVVMVKSPTGAIEAHQWSCGEWVKIGDVVGSTGVSGDKKDYNGKSYDYIFDVDIEDGKPPLKLPYNVTDNPYAAAERFLASNDLPFTYNDEVVRFIQENTKGFNLEQQQGKAQQLPVEPQLTPLSDGLHQSSVFPQKTFIKFADYKADVLYRGFVKLNLSQAPEVAFQSIETRKVKSALDDLSSTRATYLLSSVVPHILTKWNKDSKLVGYDFLRISIPRITIADIAKSSDCGEALFAPIMSSLEDVEETDLAVAMMISKVLSNLVTSPLFAQVFLSVTDHGSVLLSEPFESLCQKLVVAVKVFTSSEVSRSNKHFVVAMSATASFLYNLLAYVFTIGTLDAESASLKSISSVVDELGEDFVHANEECTYRLCVTLGNLLAAGIVSLLPSWYSIAKSTYTDARFASIYKDVEIFL